MANAAEHLDRDERELQHAEIAVVDAHEDFLAALREGKPASEVDKFYDAEQVAREKLAKLREHAKARIAGTMEVQARQQRDADAKAIKAARAMVTKWTNKLPKDAAKVERGLEIITEAMAKMERDAKEAFKALHPHDRDAKAMEAFKALKQRLIYSIQVQLSAKGVPTLTDTSVVRSHQKTTTPTSVVESFTNVVRRSDD